MAFNIAGSKEIVKQIPKEYQNSFATLLKSKKFPKDTFFGGSRGDKPTSKGYTVKVSRHILRKEKEEHLLDEKFTIRFEASRLGPTDKPKTAKKSGLDPTSIQEQMSAFYSAIRFTRRSNLNDDNCDFEEVMTNNIASRCFFSGTTGETKDSAMALYNTTEAHKEVGKWLIPDKEGGENVFMKTANALYKFASKFKGKVVYFHRGSSFMDAIYEAFKKARKLEKEKDGKVWFDRNIKGDKWNPGDMWISTLSPDPSSSKPFCYGVKDGGDCKTFDMLRDSVIQHAEDGKILAVSLKKTGKADASVTPYNLDKRKHNKKTKVKSFMFGKTGDFFKSKDIYLTFSNGSEMQFKTSEIKTRWRGEITGGEARGGNISANIANYFCEKFLNRSIGGSVKGDSWHENQYYTIDYNKMHSLYKKYSSHSTNKFNGRFKPLSNANTFKKAVQEIEKLPKKSGFIFSKYMGLLLIDTLFKGGGDDPTMCHTKIMRYAQSNLDVSSYYIKIS